jgi:divalent metal cation (Fe/Co/Zn/Cd) transporter
MTHQHHLPHDHADGHTHGIIDPSIATSERGLWAIKWSFAGLATTAVLQLLVVFLSGSVALLADTIHNFGDAATAIPLAIAFWFARKAPSERFTFGYGRVEDLAGIAIVLTILASAIVAGYESIERLLHPQEISHVGAVIAASIVGFLGNEAVAFFRIRIGQEINSAALIADGYHARVDGWTSLAVLFGAVGVWLGYPLADPNVIDELRHAAEHVPQVKEVTEVRARWLGHRLHAELNIAVDPELTIAQAHAIAAEVRHQLLHHLDYLSLVVIHVDPADQSGEAHHRIGEHVHDGLPVHSHG